MSDIMLRSEITGKVWKIERRVGDAVQPAETIMILESMKMEIPLDAPSAGTIKDILVAEGDSVAEGQHVAILAEH